MFRSLAFATDAGVRTLHFRDGSALAEDGSPVAVWRLLGVLDDGRVAYDRAAGHNQKELVVGPWRSGPIDDHSDLTVWRGQHFAAGLRRGQRWSAVIDGREMALLGQPVMKVVLSPDGAHTAIAVALPPLLSASTSTKAAHAAEAEPPLRYAVVVDGVVHPVPAIVPGMPSLDWSGAAPVVYFIPAVPPGSRSQSEHGILVIGARTPPAATEADSFTRANADREVVVGTRRRETGHGHPAASRGPRRKLVRRHEGGPIDRDAGEHLQHDRGDVLLAHAERAHDRPGP